MKSTPPLLHFDLDERRRIAAGALAPLAQALRAELDPLLARGVTIVPDRKARLTRTGGRCQFDGVLLRFDPYAPDSHECPQCHRIYAGDAHHDWWVMGAQLWHAERAAQSATLGLLTHDAAAAALSLRILTEFAVRYRSWKNSDNALGPSRPFFSTYLESIWLLNICHAIALLEAGPLTPRAADALVQVREMLVQPSRDLIASFPEGTSNRQVWNEVAILSASHLLGEHAAVAKRAASRDGLRYLLEKGLLPDGSWYEGENYHLFAHRGLWYGVELLRALRINVAPELVARFRKGFETPFAGLLPDHTIPSRRDSQYKVSVQQWRFAEWCELGLVHNPSSTRLRGLLHELYAPRDEPDGAHHRVSTADAERNEPPGSLSRASLSWRALLMASETIPEGTPVVAPSVCLPGQGLAVLRRDNGDTYVALEGGHTGGGHGHPDRLSLTLQHKRARWLDDPGTGSYVERALHWYRSTLAHAAPLFDGASQRPRPAALLAFEERGGAGWVSKRVNDIAPGVSATRSIVVAEGYLVDVLTWTSNEAHRVELPLARHARALDTHVWQAANPEGAGGLEDGFDFLTSVERASVTDDSVQLVVDGDVPAQANYAATGASSLWRADAPGVPGQPAATMHWLRTSGATGAIIGVWHWGDAVTAVELDANASPPLARVTTREGTTAVHTPTDAGWHIALAARHATSSIDLDALAKPVMPPPEDDDEPPPAREAVLVPVVPDNAAVIAALSTRGAPPAQPGVPMSNAFRVTLGEQHYVRTEQSWEEAGEPRAIVQLGVTADAFVVDVLSRTGPIVVPREGEENLLDNERRDVNADGVQLHLGREPGAPFTAAWLLVPADESSPMARVTALVPTAPRIHSIWTPTSDGWAMRMSIRLADLPRQTDGSFSLEVVVNERPADRQRRRGQLVLSGGGMWGYLRGDRSEPARAGRYRVALGAGKVR